MKTHLKLTLVLFVAVAALYFLISKNRNSGLMETNNIAMMSNIIPVSKNGNKVDSLKLKKLMPYFKVKKDEFDASGTLTYLPKDINDKPNGDAIYCYFEQLNDSVRNLRVRMQVANKEWLFYKKCQFLIDGKIYDYSPSNIEFSEGTQGTVCEWFDNAINEENFSIIKALSVAKVAKVRVVGRNYDKVLTFSDGQLSSIDHTLDLYYTMNGGLAVK